MKLILPGTLVVNAPAARVWRVIAHEFSAIGKWATAIPTSTQIDGPSLFPDAPAIGRACSPAIPGFQVVHEQFIYYDEETMQFGYAAIKGMPRFIRRAENHWAVKILSSTQSEVRIRGELELSPLWGRLLSPLLKWQIARTGRFTLEELQYYIEEGKPHPRKVHAQQRP